MNQPAFNHQTVRDTVVRVTAHDGRTFAVVGYDNGDYGITCNGNPIGALAWHAGQIDDCIAAMMELAGMKDHPVPSPSAISPASASAHPLR